MKKYHVFEAEEGLSPRIKDHEEAHTTIFQRPPWAAPREKKNARAHPQGAGGA